MPVCLDVRACVCLRHFFSVCDSHVQHVIFVIFHLHICSNLIRFEWSFWKLWFMACVCNRASAEIVIELSGA